MSLQDLAVYLVEKLVSGKLVNIFYLKILSNFAEIKKARQGVPGSSA